MTALKKLIFLLCGLLLAGLAFAYYYGNYLGPSLRPITEENMVNYLVQTKSESWLQKRISLGQENYEIKVNKIRQDQLDEYNLWKETHARCRDGSDAYRMKNKYECSQVRGKLAAIGEIDTLVFGVSNRPDFQIFIDKDSIIQSAILGKCVENKTVGQARKNGCFYR